MGEKTQKKDIMHLISSAIISYRFIIIAAFLVAAVYCALSVGRVKTNPDLTAFLPASTETRRGLTIMEDEFITYASANVMVSNITYDTAEELADEIRNIDHVMSVDLDDSTAHYINSSALLSINFDGPGGKETVVSAMNSVRSILSEYDSYISSEIGRDLISEIAQEMVGVLAIAAIVIMGILLFTSRSYFEVVIFFIVFIFAALLNMGTNFWLGEISSITNTIAIILQLALAIDYAIIFSHRYQDEVENFESHRDALVESLAKSILEISASSLTTISGLVALMLMQFRLGYDLGLVLAKGIVCSLLTVFLLMPGLIMLFPKSIRKTAHKTLIPDITGWGRFLMKSKYIFVFMFLAVIPFAVRFSSKTVYAFNDSSITELVESENRTAMHKITETFSASTPLAVLVPHENFDYEKAILEEVSALDEIKSATGLANIKIDDDHVLTDRYSPRMLAELLDINIELSTLLFQAYGFEHEDYTPIFGDSKTYSVPLVDMFLYLFEKMDQGMVTLDDDKTETINDLRGTLDMGLDQLRGENYNRLVFTSTLPVEGEESVQLVEKVRSIAEKYYGEGSVLVVGDITSARDLAASYTGDSLLISLLTIAFVFIILLFTFRTFVGCAILVFVIQGSIWINFSFPYLQSSVPCFVTNMIVSAIQMGATIDYAIVLMNRYQEMKKHCPKKEAMAAAVNQSFPTVLTSGSIMTIAGLLIAYRVSDVYVGHIGLAVGRGAFTSIILVLSVLPQLLVLCDKLIEKTTFAVKINPEDGK